MINNVYRACDSNSVNGSELPKLNSLKQESFHNFDLISSSIDQPIFPGGMDSPSLGAGRGPRLREANFDQCSLIAFKRPTPRLTY
ncbi:unnamed protein product [Fusarium graminearum]|nr:unnamed protein product [Fusarium graminearum]CAG1961095.1 unnamed protein product [Fusarium graminearum]CAG1988731.1 unnamed protein product [Fusarium graminearum]VTO83817.1 unnamed protein product [Fusarium graminearum]